MTDESAFLRTIIENPSEDGPRLVYADFLEDQGDSDRAEFIRVQVELAASVGPNPKCPLAEKIGLHASTVGMVECLHCWPNLESLRSRERALLEPSIGWSPDVFTGWICENLSTMLRQDVPSFRFERGFPALIRCDLRTLFGGRCETCSNYTQFRRMDEPCVTCHGTGTTEGIAAAVWKAAPITRVEMPDRRPTQNPEEDDFLFNWYRGPGPTQGFGMSHVLLPALWDLLDVEPHPMYRGWKSYPTLADANAALSAAAVKLGRERAGLTTAGPAGASGPLSAHPPLPLSSATPAATPVSRTESLP